MIDQTRDNPIFLEPRRGLKIPECKFYHSMDLPNVGTVFPPDGKLPVARFGPDSDPKKGHENRTGWWSLGTKYCKDCLRAVGCAVFESPRCTLYLGRAASSISHSRRVEINTICSIMLKLLTFWCLLLPAAVFAESVGIDSSYNFKEAVQHGVIDFVVNPWAHPDISADIVEIGKLAPGLVNRLGFEYGGMSSKRLNFSGDAASQIHGLLPRARIGGGFPENLKADYRAALPCDSETDLRTFTHDAITGKAYGGNKDYYWVDISLVPAQEYYICIGKAQIRRQFDHLHFEESDEILANCASRAVCVLGYKRVRDELARYAKDRGIGLSFSGEPVLAGEMALDSVYIPARFYVDDFDQQYRNKVSTDVGVGHTYVLSPLIVQDLVREVPKGTNILFYVDNFDSRQDDLRRMVELDGPNRRELIKRSAMVAAKFGATFVPSYNHCDGCIPLNLIGDPCEADSKSNLSVYNARACGDLNTIKASLSTPR